MPHATILPSWCLYSLSFSRGLWHGLWLFTHQYHSPLAHFFFSVLKMVTTPPNIKASSSPATSSQSWGSIDFSSQSPLTLSHFPLLCLHFTSAVRSLVVSYLVCSNSLLLTALHLLAYFFPSVSSSSCSHISFSCWKPLLKYRLRIKSELKYG